MLGRLIALHVHLLVARVAQRYQVARLVVATIIVYVVDVQLALHSIYATDATDMAITL